ncbi:ObirGr11 [Ooceraea biroi]|uniref:Gustatory receptor n=1 Tax=Ooceraea biroi TaxID=2015173 RepID=A0A3L8DU21_OOCBI|nr:uncharacterized protein LOC105275101 isoform X2 [Ooceraea biroi]RLU23663.1 ObirGr11 [Ooceraea biroi]
MLENCRWLLYASRFYGCHPHTINERSILKHFHLLLVYSLTMCSLHCVMAYYATDVSSCIAKNAMIVGCTLQRINQYSQSIYIILSILLSCLRHIEFERAVAAACKFDDLTRHYHWSINNVQINHYTQYFFMMVIIITWSVFGVLRKLAVPQMALHIIVIQCITRSTFSIEIAKFCFLYNALRHRFHRLNGLCCELAGIGVNIDIGVSGLHAKRLTLPNLQRLHCCLTNATNYLTSYYNIQLLCWISCLLIDILTFIFTILYGVNNTLLICVRCIILVQLTLQIIAISRVSHLTCDQANALAETVYSVQAFSFKYIKSCTEAIELGVFLRTHPLRVRICDLFNLDSRFIFSAFGVILMYVILASSIH